MWIAGFCSVPLISCFGVWGSDESRFFLCELFRLLRRPAQRFKSKPMMKIWTQLYVAIRIPFDQCLDFFFLLFFSFWVGLSEFIKVDFLKVSFFCLTLQCSFYAQNVTSSFIFYAGS